MCSRISNWLLTYSSTQTTQITRIQKREYHVHDHELSSVICFYNLFFIHAVGKRGTQAKCLSATMNTFTSDFGSVMSECLT